jgi:hypothetical protein
MWFMRWTDSVSAWRVDSKKPSTYCEGWVLTLRQHPDLNWGMEVLQTYCDFAELLMWRGVDGVAAVGLPRS